MLEEVAPGVWVAHATAYATTSTVVVGRDGDALVVDPAVAPAEIDALAEGIRARGWRVVAGFSTHPHWDHLLWSPSLGAVPRWATPHAVVTARRRRARLAAEALAELGTWPPDVAACFADLAPLPGGRDGVPGCSVRTVVVGHRAHAPGHAAVLLPDQRVLLAGDMLSDVEMPLLDADADDPIADHHDGLDRLAVLVDSGLVDVLVPGHGGVADGAEVRRRIALDRSYLADLAAGRPSADPRLAVGPAWLRAEHEAQERLLAAARSSP